MRAFLFVLVLVLEKAILPQKLPTATQSWRPMEGLGEKKLSDDEYENDKHTSSRPYVDTYSPRKGDAFS
jgi:hypothetical protein